MRRRRLSIQGDLFGASRSQELKGRVRELDGLIAQALRKSKYDRARMLTEQQEKIIQELVEMGEKGAAIEPVVGEPHIDE